VRTAIAHFLQRRLYAEAASPNDLVVLRGGNALCAAGPLPYELLGSRDTSYAADRALIVT
jgi:hypothetical protein